MPSIECLDTSVHDRGSFNCSVDELNNYLTRRAAADARKSVSVCYVLEDDEDSSIILGYYTLSGHSVQLRNLPQSMQKRLPRYPQVPATLLGRLAVDSKHAGQRYGELLLLDALTRAYDARKAIGSALVVVDAKNQRAGAYYAKYGFEHLTTEPMRLVIPMATIGKVIPNRT